MNKIVVVTLAMVLVASMAYAGVASNGLLLAKKSHESGSSGGDSGPSSSGSSSSGGSNGGNDGSSGTSGKGGDQGKDQSQKEINNPLHPGKEDTKDISDIPSENCSHGSCATPITPTHEGGGISCSDSIGHSCPPNNPPHNPGNFPCRFHSLGPGDGCITHFPIPPHIHHTIVIHKTKVIHKKDLIGIPTVFVPKIGLVEPLNCKLNENNGKISCEFVVVKVVN